MDKKTLELVGEWAQSRVASGEEPPWTFHKLKTLAEISMELAEGMSATVAFEPKEAPDNVVPLVRPKRPDTPHIPMPA